MPQPSFLSRLPAMVATRAGSKHFRRATHRRDFIENGQSVLPPTLPANLFEKNLLKNARDAVTSPIVDTPRCTLRQCRSARARPACFCRSMQKADAKQVLRLGRRCLSSRRTRFKTLHVDNSLPVGHSRAMAKPALGRGLGALLSGSPPAAKTPPAPVLATPQTSDLPVLDAREGVERVPLARIRPCPLQPRKDFSVEALRELADSI